MGLPEQQLEDAIAAAVEDEIDGRDEDGDEDRTAGLVPLRVYAFFGDYPPAPAMYAEFDVVSDDSDGASFSSSSHRTDGASDDHDEREDARARRVPVIIHNFRYYPLGMDRWNLGFVDLLVMNELHELTHWAMTPDEREYFDDLSRRYRRGDGYWLNPTLLEVIEWLPGEHATVVDGKPIPSLRDRIRRWLRRAVDRLEAGRE